MKASTFNRLTGFSYPGLTQSFGTAIVRGIPPYRGAPGKSSPLIYTPNPSGYSDSGLPPTVIIPSAFTHVTRVEFLSNTTAQVAYIFRPLNYVTVKSVVAAGGSSIILNQNPGKYSTNYNYPMPTGQTVACVADLTPTTTHYYAVQLLDGTWFFDLISAWTAGTLTVTTTATLPSPTVGTNVIGAGAPFYLFGTTSTVDPATGMTPPSWATQAGASAQASQVFSDSDGLVDGIHAGDPLLFYCSNVTATCALGLISGYYSTE